MVGVMIVILAVSILVAIWPNNMDATDSVQHQIDELQEYEARRAKEFYQEQQKQQEQMRKVVSGKDERINHYVKSSLMPDIMQFINQGGLPYKIVVNCDSIDVYYEGGSSKYDFLAHGIREFSKICAPSYKVNTSGQYMLAVAINIHLEKAFSIMEHIKYNTITEHGDYYVYPAEIKCVELFRELKSF